MSKAVNEKGEFLFNMPFGTQETDNQYLMSCFITLTNFEKVIEYSDSLNDHRFVPMTRAALVKIEDRKIREEILKRFESCLETIEADQCSDQKKDAYRLQLCQYAMAEVISWLALTFPFSSENLIVPI